jgi:hypothetical protein
MKRLMTAWVNICMYICVVYIQISNCFSAISWTNGQKGQQAFFAACDSSYIALPRTKADHCSKSFDRMQLVKNHVLIRRILALLILGVTTSYVVHVRFTLIAPYTIAIDVRAICTDPKSPIFWRP